MSTFNKVKEVIIDKLGVEEDMIKTEAHFVNDLGADSLDTVELVMAFEEEFGAEIPDEEAEKITTVQSAVDWINNNIQKSSISIFNTWSFIDFNETPIYFSSKNSIF